MTSRRLHALALFVALSLFAVVFGAAGCGGAETTTSIAEETTVTTAVETGGSPSAGTSGNAIVKGLVDNPMTLTAGELETINMADITVDHPKLGMTDYHGVLLSDVFAAVGVQSKAASLVMTAADGYMAEVALSDIEASAEAMLTVADDGMLGVVIPGMESKAWVKDVISLDFR